MSNPNGKTLRGPDLVREVFARVGKQDPAVGDLYTEDATLLWGKDGQASGRDEIRAFYLWSFRTFGAKPEVEAVLEDPPRYVAIVNVPTDDGHYRVLDLFEIGEDGIHRLEVFIRS